MRCYIATAPPGIAAQPRSVRRRFRKFRVPALQVKRGPRPHRGGSDFLTVVPTCASPERLSHALRSAQGSRKQGTVASGNCAFMYSPRAVST